MIFSVPRDRQLDLLQAIFRPQCMLMVSFVRIRVRVKVNVSVNRWGLKIAPVMYICPSWTENNIEPAIASLT